MEKSIGRNDLCSCGSGKKYKHCCIHQGQATAEAKPEKTPDYRFEPGAYGDPGAYVPSIACLQLDEKVAEEKWNYIFLITNEQEHFEEEDAAGERAVLDLAEAMNINKNNDSQYPMAEYLQGLGYTPVSGYNISES
ncbi:MAG: hypothetical protein COB67_05390 [SAR324 cluster bacterium]|uniref:Zinc chelation protein SecC n=1 Tax=SAR324 cluster bacterium TaxID=2024889 RepID=A0A2A4T775_9DELT|nr:MAG: hypothetical protein COB67_05390 [SAR324 cluster bacterium]